MKKLVTVEQVEHLFEMLGFTLLGAAKRNENGPDYWIVKGKKPYSVEFKKCKLTKRNSVQVPPVEANRKNDDFILIEHPSGYFLFESMSDHLKCCTPKGYRTLWR